MSHTPGPWQKTPCPIVPGIPGLGIFGADGSPIASVYHTFKDRERDNANILWAALDLLEACEADAILWQHYTRCLECAGSRFCTDAMELAATASSKRAIAIAKAKGEK